MPFDHIVETNNIWGLQLFTKSNSKNSTQNIYVDVSIIARRDAGTGIQRVVRAIWLQLRSIEDRQIKIIAVAATRRKKYRVIGDNFLDTPYKRLPREIPFISKKIKMFSGDIFLGLDLGLPIVPAHRKQLKKWKKNGAKLAFVIYDLLPLLHPEWFDDKISYEYKIWLQYVLENGDFALCISRSVADELIDLINECASGKRLQVNKIRLGYSLHMSNPSRGVPENFESILKWIRSKPTILMVGTLEPRKGYDQALSAFELIWSDAGRSYKQLLIVGRPGWKTDMLQERLRTHPDHGTKFHWVENASDECLEKIYEAVDGFLITSNGEGFGLPLVEASYYKKKVMARDIAVFREIAPPKTVFFEGQCPKVLADCLDKWDLNDNYSNELIDMNDWDITTSDIISAIKSAINK